jgi:hypothetical protein
MQNSPPLGAPAVEQLIADDFGRSTPGVKASHVFGPVCATPPNPVAESCTPPATGLAQNCVKMKSPSSGVEVMDTFGPESATDALTNLAFGKSLCVLDFELFRLIAAKVIDELAKIKSVTPPTMSMRLTWSTSSWVIGRKRDNTPSLDRPASRW